MLFVATALPLAACSTDTSLLSASAEPTRIAPPPVDSRPISQLVAFRPPLGPPDSVNTELSRQLNDAAIDNGIALVADAKFKHDLLLRGYLTALRKGNGVNLTYLWDVIDARGQRINRFEGEEALSGVVDAKDPWSAMTPAVARAIAQRTMGDLARWLKTNPPLPTAGQGGSIAPVGVGAAPAASLTTPGGRP